MPKYLCMGGYRSEAWTLTVENPRDRASAVRKVGEDAGATKIECGGWATDGSRQRETSGQLRVPTITHSPAALRAPHLLIVALAPIGMNRYSVLGDSEK